MKDSRLYFDMEKFIYESNVSFPPIISDNYYDVYHIVHDETCIGGFHRLFVEKYRVLNTRSDFYIKELWRD